jgi:hypothetical protein
MLSDPLRRDVLGEMRRFNPAFLRWCTDFCHSLENLGLVRCFAVHKVKPVPPGWIVRFQGLDAMAAVLRLWREFTERERLVRSYCGFERPDAAFLQLVAV